MKNNHNQTYEQEMKSNLKGFAFFYSGQLFSILGSSVVQFVLIWWITIETESALMLAIASLIGYFPRIILTPIAGVFVDRWNRKALISVVDTIQACVTALLAILFLVNQATISIILIFLAIRGAAQAFQRPALSALVPILVPKKYLSQVNSIQMFLSTIITIIGPMLAVLLLSFLKINQILWIDPITFIMAVIPLLLIRIPKTPKKFKQKKNFKQDFKEGLIFMKKKKGLFSLMFLFSTTNFFVIPMFTLLNLFVYINHSGTELNLATILAFNQIGYIAGTILFSFWKGFKKKVKGAAIGIFGGLSGGIVTSLAPQGMFWIMCIGFFLHGFFFCMCNVHSQTLWQSIVPKDKLGRVFSVRITIAQIISPISMALAGLIASIVNIQLIILLSHIFGYVSLFCYYFFTSMKKLDQPEPSITKDFESISISSQKQDMEA